MAHPTPEATPLQVLHVLTTSQRRGAETYASSLDRALAHRGLRSTAVALRGAPAGSPALDVEVLDLDGRSPWLQLRRLRPAMRAADVVVAHGSRTLPMCAVASAGLRTPFVYRVIGETGHWSAGGLRHARVGLLLRRAAAVVTYYDAASEAVVAHHRLDPSMVRTIPKGIDPDTVADASPGARRAARRTLELQQSAKRLVVALGALAPEKDLALAVAASALVPDAVLALVGDGPERDALLALAAELGADVHLPGATGDPRPWLLAADAVVLTSRTEGVPGALLEAALAGTPAVTVDVGGVREVVEHGVTGVVVGERTPEAIAAALEAVLGQAATMGPAARRRALEHADLASVAAAWESLLREVAR